MAGYTTDLSGTGRAEWKHHRGEHVFSSIVYSTGREYFRSDFGLEPSNQIHVERQGENSVGRQDDYMLSCLVNGDHEIKQQIRTNYKKMGKEGLR